MDSAQRWIGLSDGGSGLENWLGTYFAWLDEVILDFYHAAESLGAWPARYSPAMKWRARAG
jgi:hypothetical protein